MKGAVGKDGVFYVEPESMSEAFALGALWEAWRRKPDPEKSVAIKYEDGKP